MLDHDQDGWPDIFIANDTQPNKLYRNNRDGTFTELGLKSGLAFSEEGRARAGMGVDAADVDNSGKPVVAVTNFSGEMLGLYAPLGDGQYIDRAPRSDVGRATRQTLGWGCFFFDVDLDGLQDLLVVNGHLDAALARAERQVRYAESPHLFLNRRRALRGRGRRWAGRSGSRRSAAARVRRHRRRRRSRHRHHQQQRARRSSIAAICPAATAACVCGCAAPERIATPSARR